MARLSNGILGPIHGKLGSVVGAVWKQTAYLRTLPKDRKGGYRPTPAQVACREKFKFVQQWLVPFYAYVTVGFRNFAKDKTEINAAFSSIYRNATIGAYPNLSIDYNKVILTKGNLPGLFDLKVQFVQSDRLELIWKPNHNDDSSTDDQVMLIVYNRELKIVDGFIGGCNRASLKCSLTLNPRLIGKSLDIYVSVVSMNGKRVANSEYLGRVSPK